MESIKTDLEEWDSSFREANALYQKLAKLQKLHEQYQAGQVVLNSDDRVHADLQKMIDNKGDGTARHLATVLKKAKTDRDHNRSGTTKLRLELARAQAASKGTKKKGAEIKKVGDQYYQHWSTPPQSLAAQYQADRAKPKDVYLQIRHIAIEEPETIEHSKMVRKLKMYRDAIPDKPAEEVMKKFITNRLDLIEKVKHKETYTKAFLLKVVTTMLSPEDKEKVKAFLQSQERSRSMSHLADANRMHRLQQAYERTGKDGLLSLNTKSKEFQNCFAVTQSAYERAKSGFVVPRRGNTRGNRGNQRGRPNNRQNYSGSNSNDNKKQNNQNQSSNQSSGFTKKTNRKRGRNNNSGNNTNDNNAGRNQGQPNNNQNGHSKSNPTPNPKIIPKYDETKIPAGLSAWSDQKVDPKVRQLIGKHFQLENVVIDSPTGTLDFITQLNVIFSLNYQDMSKKKWKSNDNCFNWSPQLLSTNWLST